MLVAGYPLLRMTRREFDGLLEYSSSLPTGTTIGKRWRRNDLAFGPWLASSDEHLHFFDGTPEAGEQPKLWIVGEYQEDPDPKMVRIVWHRVEIVES